VRRKISKDDTPRRRGARAVAVQQAERGLAMRILLRSPKDTVVGALAFAAVTAIIANALFLQKGYHPAPMFGSVVVLPSAGSVSSTRLPRSRSGEAEAAVSEPRVSETKPVERAADSKVADPVGNLAKATSASSATAPAVLRPPQPVPVSTRGEAPASLGSRRVAVVQRALTEYGYGQLKPTGTIGTDTQAAIQKFERDRKLPITGQVSDRLVRELAAVIGHPID
jgi:putative peptidoglycan binding protein